MSSKPLRHSVNWEESTDLNEIKILFSQYGIEFDIEDYLTRRKVDQSFPNKILGDLLNNPKLISYNELLSDLIYPLQKEMMAFGYDIVPPSIYVDEDENDIELYWNDEKYDLSMLINIDITTHKILLSAEFEKMDEYLDVRVTNDTIVHMMGAWLKSIKKNQ